MLKLETKIDEDFKGVKCSLCKKHTFVFYTIDNTFSICGECYGSIPNHIPFEQIVRYALRLIRGKDGLRKQN